jgi:hypothetical protein
MNPCRGLQSIQSPGPSSARSRLAANLLLIASSFPAQVVAPQRHGLPAQCRASILQQWEAGCLFLAVWIS